jgi:hypothetical protein
MRLESIRERVPGGCRQLTIPAVRILAPRLSFVI